MTNAKSEDRFETEAAVAGNPGRGTVALADADGSQERPESLALVGDHRLVLVRGSGEDVLRLEGKDGRLQVEVVVTESGTRLELQGTDVRIRSTGDLSLDGETVAITGRERVSLRSEGDLDLEAAGLLRSEAHAQRLVARRGDTTIYANDDVRLDGERIKMNC